MFFITYTVACLIPDRITQVGNYLTTTEWGWVWCEGLFMQWRIMLSTKAKDQSGQQPPISHYPLHHTKTEFNNHCFGIHSECFYVLNNLASLWTFFKTLSISHMVSGFNQILLSCRYSSKSYDIYQAFFGGIFLHFFHSVLVRNLANFSLKSSDLFVCSQLCINS